MLSQMEVNLRTLISLSIALLLSSSSFAGVNAVTEEDGAPIAYPWKMKFANGSVTDNGDGTVSISGGGSGSPGGLNTQVQFNDSGSFAGDSAMTFNKTTDVFSVTSVTSTTNTTQILSASGSGGMTVEANNGTDIGLLGSGNTSNVTWYGSHNFDASHSVKNGATTAGFVDFYEDSDDGSNYVKVKASAMSGDFTLSLPPADAVGVMKSDGSGNLTLGTATTSIGGTGSPAGFALYSPLFAGTTTTGAFQSGTLGLTGHVLTSNGEGVLPTFKAAATGGGGTPGGSDTQVQFNDGSAFGGDAGMTYNKTTDSLTLVGSVTAASDVVMKNEAGYWTGIGVGDTTITEGKVVIKQANSNYPALYAQNTGGGSWAVAGYSLFSGGAANTAGYLGGLSGSWIGVMGTSETGIGGLFSVNGTGTSLWAADGDIRFDTVSQDYFFYIDDTGNYAAFGGSTDLGGFVNINGRADEVQLYVQGHSTQTNDVMVVEKSDGTDILSVQNDGSMILTPVATAPTGVVGKMYVDSSPTPDELCFYDGAAWQGISSGTDANCA